MSCTHCQPCPTSVHETPFIEGARIAEDGHTDVSLAACARCREPAVCYRTDIYDDSWKFWCPIGEPERQRLLAPGDDAADVIRTAISIIRAHADVLQRHPVHGLGWVPGAACCLEGAPW
jgi:hypothetical protein